MSVQFEWSPGIDGALLKTCQTELLIPKGQKTDGMTAEESMLSPASRPLPAAGPKAGSGLIPQKKVPD